MKYCPKCNIYFSTDGNFCEKCGNPLAEVMPSFCTQCGKKLQDGAMFCGACGAGINASVSSVVSDHNTNSTYGTGTIPATGDGMEKIKRNLSNIPKTAIIGAIILAFALLGGGGYYLLTHNDKSASKLQPKTGITGNIKYGNNSTSSGKNTAGNVAGNIQHIQPIRPGTVAKAYHSSADKEGSYIHSAALAVDGNPASCWSEGVPGLGIGENIVIHFNGTYKVSGMNIWVGHQKSQSLFYQNARPTSVRIEGSDGSSEVYSLRDTFGAQRVDFKEPINTNLIKIVVDQVVPGNKYQDTCIAEVRFF